MDKFLFRLGLVAACLLWLLLVIVVVPSGALFTEQTWGESWAEAWSAVYIAEDEHMWAAFKSGEKIGG